MVSIKFPFLTTVTIRGLLKINVLGFGVPGTLNKLLQTKCLLLMTSRRRLPLPILARLKVNAASARDWNPPNMEVEESYRKK